MVANNLSVAEAAAAAACQESAGPLRQEVEAFAGRVPDCHNMTSKQPYARHYSSLRTGSIELEEVLVAAAAAAHIYFAVAGLAGIALVAVGEEGYTAAGLEEELMRQGKRRKQLEAKG